jgi:hypothetical protein
MPRLISLLLLKRESSWLFQTVTPRGDMGNRPSTYLWSMDFTSASTDQSAFVVHLIRPIFALFDILLQCRSEIRQSTTRSDGYPRARRPWAGRGRTRRSTRARVPSSTTTATSTHHPRPPLPWLSWQTSTADRRRSGISRTSSAQVGISQ